MNIYIDFTKNFKFLACSITIFQNCNYDFTKNLFKKIILIEIFSWNRNWEIITFSFVLANQPRMVVNEIKWISQIVINVTDSIGEKKYNLQNDIFDKIASTMNMFDHVGAEQYGRVFIQKSKNKFNSKFSKACCRRGRKHVQEAVELLGSPKKLFVLNFFLNKPINVKEILCRHNIESWLGQKSSYDCCCCALENIYVGWQEREGPDSGRWPPVAICFFVIWCYTFTFWGQIIYFFYDKSLSNY